MGPKIELCQVSLAYNGNQVLEPISKVLVPGRCHVLMGPNGGGKTSLLRSILGLTPFEGEIKIHWQQDEARIGFVPQKASFEASLPLTVMDFVLLNQTRHPLFWRQNARHKQRALAQLERLGMAERANRRMGQLSGGEQQRVLFAQALLDEPDLLVLDEPTTGMDEQGVKYLEALILELVAEKRTLLAVHHDVAAVQRLPDPLVHVINRRILQSGPASQLLQSANLATLFQHYTQSQHAEVA